jgi:pseudouridine-5'-phosphate glycosidase
LVKGSPASGERAPSAVIVFADEVRDALEAGAPVVALETTLVAHGFPPGEGVAVAAESERRVRAAGAVPATIGLLDGQVRVGITEDELDRFRPDARKCGPRDIAVAIAQRATGATTVGGTLAVCRAAGIRFMGTGGIGGVHRDPRDVSPDLEQLARTSCVVVSSGAKSLLDVEATMERLETLAVPVLGYRTDDVPLFYSGRGGPRASGRVESAEEAARVARAQWQLGAHGLLLAQPPPDDLDDVEPLIAEALALAAAQGVAGQAVTPFVLSHLHRESGGRTLRVNAALVAANAGLAAEVAVAYGRLGGRE